MKDQLSWLHHILSPTNVCKKNWVQATMAWYNLSINVGFYKSTWIMLCAAAWWHVTRKQLSHSPHWMRCWHSNPGNVTKRLWIWRLKRFRQILKNLYKYISQRYGYASKIRSPKIQLVSYENSSISTSEKGHLTCRTITYPYYYAIYTYIYIKCLSTCWRCIVSSNHIFVKDLKPQPIAESEFLMVFGSTRPGTVLRGDLQLLKIGPPIPGLLGDAMGVKGYHQHHEVPIPNNLFRWEGTDYKGEVWEVRILRVGTGKSLEYCQV